MKKPDIVAGAIGTAIGAWILFEGASFPVDLVMKVGPSFYPNLLAGLLILFSVILAVLGGLGRSKGSSEPLNPGSAGFARAALSLAAAVIYTVLLKPVGFFIMTTLFVLALMTLLGNRRPLQLALVPLGTSVGVWLIFQKLLTISLPAGLLAGLPF